MSILKTEAETVTQKCLVCGLVVQVPVAKLQLGIENGGRVDHNQIKMPPCSKCGAVEYNTRLWHELPAPHAQTSLRNGLAAELKRRGQLHPACKALHDAETGAPPEPGRFPFDPLGETAAARAAAIAERDARHDAEVAAATATADKSRAAHADPASAQRIATAAAAVRTQMDALTAASRAANSPNGTMAAAMAAAAVAARQSHAEAIAEHLAAVQARGALVVAANAAQHVEWRAMIRRSMWRNEKLPPPPAVLA